MSAEPTQGESPAPLVELAAHRDNLRRLERAANVTRGRRDEAIVRAMRAGHTRTEAAAAAGVTAIWVGRICERAGLRRYRR